MNFSHGLLAMMLIGMAGVASAQDTTADSGRFVYREVTVGSTAHRYAIWLPPGHASQPSWPAIVFLHGSGECGTDGVNQTHVGLPAWLVKQPERWPFVVVMPQKPVEEQEWEEREDLVRATLAASIREFGVDPRRVALTGMSQGGHGAWYLGARDSSRWRALVAVCGYGRARTVAKRVLTLPVWAFHGLKDDLVDPNDARTIIAELRRLRTARGLDPEGARLTLFPDANHNSWDPAYSEAGLASWLIEQTQPR
jgi:predicted peptidase